MQFLKTWMGVVTGSMAGRDDGYPEVKYRYYDSIDELARDFGKNPGEEYYKLTKLNKESLKLDVAQSLEQQNKRVVDEKKLSLQSKIEALQKELNDLNRR